MTVANPMKSTFTFLHSAFASADRTDDGGKLDRKAGHEAVPMPGNTANAPT